MIKETGIYNGEKTVSSTSAVVKAGRLHKSVNIEQYLKNKRMI